MRWQWRQRQTETPLWPPPGRTRIPDGDTILRPGQTPWGELWHPHHPKPAGWR